MQETKRIKKKKAPKSQIWRPSIMDRPPEAPVKSVAPKDLPVTFHLWPQGKRSLLQKITGFIFQEARA